MQSNNTPAGIAFFDFDKTIIKVDSGPIYGLQIYRDGVARAIPSFRALFAGIGYKLGLVRRRSVARVGVGEYAGLHRDVLDKWMKEAYPRLIKSHLSPVIVDRIREHQQNGLLTGIISASPPFFVREAAADLRMDFVYGSELKFNNDICTGTYSGRYLGGPTKRDIALAKAKSMGISAENCWFYSDHVADLPLLEAVGNPIAVGPESTLRRIAMERGWTIIEHE